MRVSRSQKKEPSLTSLWRRSVGREPPSPAEQPILCRGRAHYPRTQPLLSLSADQPALASSGTWEVPKIALSSHRCTEADRVMPCPLPHGPTAHRPPPFPWLIDISPGPRPVCFPKPEDPGSPLLSSQTSPSLMFTNGASPAQPGARGHPVPRCCENPSVSFPHGGESAFSQIADGPLFSEAQGWMMDKAGLVRIEVNVSDSFSFNDCFSSLYPPLPPTPCQP